MEFELLKKHLGGLTFAQVNVCKVDDEKVIAVETQEGGKVYSDDPYYYRLKDRKIPGWNSAKKFYSFYYGFAVVGNNVSGHGSTIHFDSKGQTENPTFTGLGVYTHQERQVPPLNRWIAGRVEEGKEGKLPDFIRSIYHECDCGPNEFQWFLNNQLHGGNLKMFAALSVPVFDHYQPHIHKRRSSKQKGEDVMCICRALNPIEACEKAIRYRLHRLDPEDTYSLELTGKFAHDGMTHIFPLINHDSPTDWVVYIKEIGDEEVIDLRHNYFGTWDNYHFSSTKIKKTQETT